MGIMGKAGFAQFVSMLYYFHRMKKHSVKNARNKDQYTVVLEDLRDHFRIFGEGLQFVRDDLKGVHKKLDSHTQMIGQLMIDMQEVKYELKKRPTFDDLKGIEKRLTRLEARR